MNVPHRKIAEALNVTRQHVSSLVKRGLPTTSLAAAEGWYRTHVNTRYSKGRHRRCLPVYSVPASFTDDSMDLPTDLQSSSFGIDLAPHKPRPITLVEWRGEDVHTDEEVEAWMNREVTTVEEAVRVSAFFIQTIRLHLDWMPYVMAERVNPLDPDFARRELEHWLDTMNRECFTDHEDNALPPEVAGSQGG
jgi:hypothetical protein